MCFNKAFNKFSFRSENGIRTIINFRSLNSHSGITKSSLFLLKHLMIWQIKPIGKSAKENL